MDEEAIDTVEAGRSSEGGEAMNDIDRDLDDTGGTDGIEGMGVWGQTLQPRELKQ